MNIRTWMKLLCALYLHGDGVNIHIRGGRGKIVSVRQAVLDRAPDELGAGLQPHLFEDSDPISAYRPWA